MSLLQLPEMKQQNLHKNESQLTWYFLLGHLTEDIVAGKVFSGPMVWRDIYTIYIIHILEHLSRRGGKGKLWFRCRIDPSHFELPHNLDLKKTDGFHKKVFVTIHKLGSVCDKL